MLPFGPFVSLCVSLGTTYENLRVTANVVTASYGYHLLSRLIGFSCKNQWKINKFALVTASLSRLVTANKFTHKMRRISCRDPLCHCRVLFNVWVVVSAHRFVVNSFCLAILLIFLPTILTISLHNIVGPDGVLNTNRSNTQTLYTDLNSCCFAVVES